MTAETTDMPQGRALVVPEHSPPAAVEETERESFFDRTVINLRDLWRGIAGDRDDAAAVEKSVREWRARIDECLFGTGGEVTARARTAALGRDYLDLAPEERAAFLRLLAEDYGADPATVAEAARAVLAATDTAGRDRTITALKGALATPRRTLLTQFNALPEGVKFLVDLRQELLGLVKADPVYRGLLDDLTDLLRSWFDIGFLEITRITWDSPASLLEKLIAYEAVHEISSWDDLKNRLDSDRRCFAFFHPRMPEEPLIFVEVALTDGLANKVQALLDPDAPLMDPYEADTAIFYSISNAQKGLAGISFGNFLIKRVVALLSAEFPNLKRFATLSPVPGFAKWLKSQDAGDLLLPAEKKLLPRRGEGDQHPLSLTRNPDWIKNETLAGKLEAPLTRLIARYLVREKRAVKGRGPDTALDPVAHFHLSNGARLERINWMGDTSAKGLGESAGIMVNYLYDLRHIEANHEGYTGKAKVAASSAVRALARKKS